jgi:hypothetical protein
MRERRHLPDKLRFSWNSASLVCSVVHLMAGLLCADWKGGRSVTFAQLSLASAASVAVFAGTILLSALRAPRGSSSRVYLLFFAALFAFTSAMFGVSAYVAMRSAVTAPAWWVAFPAVVLVLSVFMLGRAVVRGPLISPPTV